MSRLHYKKDGSLDMRFSSSKAASSGSYSAVGGCGRYSVGNAYSTSRSDGLHYKKDGTLDMRYSSSKEAVVRGSTLTTSDLHYKKDGTLDMRFSSSKEAVSSGNGNISNAFEKMHLKKDGTPDLRYKSSQISQCNKGVQNFHLPNSIPLTKAGYPDMRTTAAKQWVEEQARKLQFLPEWIPRKKDGSLDKSKSIAQTFLGAHGRTLSLPSSRNCRDAYYAKKIDNQSSEFRRLIEAVRRENVDIPKVDILPNTDKIKHALGHALRKRTNSRDVMETIPSSLPLIDYKDLKSSFLDEEASLLGRGSFGVVLKGLWKGQDVAVKRLHLPQLTKQECTSFISELVIIDCMGRHPNLVGLHGYTLKPPCLIMEFVEFGSLNHLLHYCEDEEIEAKMTDGRIKKRLLDGIVNGMIQLHSVNVVHADLKPQNVLISKNYVSKITDFGLSRLRGKTSSSVASKSIEDGENVIAGTAAYMAPELLNSGEQPDFPCDVYSFGIMLNEVLVEEEPYSDQYLNFKGRGPFGPTNYALQGHRPCISTKKVPQDLKNLIEKCWSANRSIRPTFQKISVELHGIHFPDSF